jgi:hypothetical protein
MKNNAVGKSQRNAEELNMTWGFSKGKDAGDKVE